MVCNVKSVKTAGNACWEICEYSTFFTYFSMPPPNFCEFLREIYYKSAAADAGDDLDQAIVHLVLQCFKINGALDSHSSFFIKNVE